MPDIEDMRSKITKRTKAIVIINPNNPTGAVYSPEVLRKIADLAVKHGLIVMADEIYDKILYDDAVHTTFAAIAPDVLTITFNGLSRAYRLAGFRSGWMVMTGPRRHAASYIEGVGMLTHVLHRRGSHPVVVFLAPVELVRTRAELAMPVTLDDSHPQPEKLQSTAQ